MELIIKIQWEDPESQHYVYPPNIARALSRFFNDTDFKVETIKPELVLNKETIKHDAIKDT